MVVAPIHLFSLSTINITVLCPLTKCMPPCDCDMTEAPYVGGHFPLNYPSFAPPLLILAGSSLQSVMGSPMTELIGPALSHGVSHMLLHVLKYRILLLLLKRTLEKQRKDNYVLQRKTCEPITARNRCGLIHSNEAMSKATADETH